MVISSLGSKSTNASVLVIGHWLFLPPVSRQDLVTLHDPHTRLAHFINGAGAVAFLDFDTAASIDDQ